MWKTIVSYFPDWLVLMQAFCLFVPFAISKVFLWLRTAGDE